MISDEDLDFIIAEVSRDAARVIYERGTNRGLHQGEEAGFKRGRLETAEAVDAALADLEMTGGATVHAVVQTIRAMLKKLLRADLSTPLEDLGLTVRAYNALKRDGRNTLGDLVGLTNDQLSELRQFGEKSRDELDVVLELFGYKRGEPLDLTAHPSQDREYHSLAWAARL